MRSMPTLKPIRTAGPGLLRLAILALVSTGLLFAGCSKTVVVTIPPKVDLKAYKTVGVIELSGKPDDGLTRDATQKFFGNLQGAQPGVRLLELGSRESVLKDLGRSDLDFQAIRALGEKYGIDAVLTGNIELSDVRPDVNFSGGLTSVSAQAKIDGKMNAKLWETASGASVWSNSSWGSWSVGGVKLTNGGMPSVGYKNPKEKRDEIVMALIKALNHDFWPTYQKRKVKD